MEEYPSPKGKVKGSIPFMGTIKMFIRKWICRLFGHYARTHSFRKSDIASYYMVCHRCGKELNKITIHPGLGWDDIDLYHKYLTELEYEHFLNTTG